MSIVRGTLRPLRYELRAYEAGHLGYVLVVYAPLSSPPPLVLTADLERRRRAWWRAVYWKVAPEVRDDL